MEELKIILDHTEDKMKKIIEALKEHIKVIRTGRANPGILDGILVNYYGVDTPIGQVGSISAPEANLLVVQPWDKTALKSIEKAILASERGLNPNNDGNIIRIPIPALTEERRKELVKQVKKISEEFKVQIRNTRRDGNDDLKKIEKGKVSEDSKEEAVEKIQVLTDSYIKKVDEIIKNKEASIMEI
ncbi:MAG: ribosome recycling factor [Fusobacteria bacterium]|nr:ribosome recycling factor [Fusobacteriota bacterium]